MSLAAQAILKKKADESNNDRDAAYVIKEAYENLGWTRKFNEGILTSPYLTI